MNRLDLDGAVRKLQIVHAALVLSLLGYLFVGEMVGRRGFVGEASVGAIRVEAGNSFHLAIAFIALGVAVAVVLLRGRIAPSYEDMLRREPENPVAIQRWWAANIVSFALCEAIGLFGLVSRVMGAQLRRAIWFYATAIILMLIYRPSQPRPI